LTGRLQERLDLTENNTADLEPDTYFGEAVEGSGDFGMAMPSASVAAAAAPNSDMVGGSGGLLDNSFERPEENFGGWAEDHGATLELERAMADLQKVAAIPSSVAIVDAPAQKVFNMGKGSAVLPAYVASLPVDTKAVVESLAGTQYQNCNILAAPHTLAEETCKLSAVDTKKGAKVLKTKCAGLGSRTRTGVAAWDMQLDLDDAEIVRVGGWFKQVLDDNFARKMPAISLMNYYYIIGNPNTRCGYSKVRKLDALAAV
jgi:hypothetical protein